MRQESEFTSLSISLPRAQREFVEARAKAEGFGSVSEYIQELIRRDEKENVPVDLEKELMEALESGPAVHFEKGFFQSLRDRIRKSRSGGSQSA